MAPRKKKKEKKKRRRGNGKGEEKEKENGEQKGKEKEEENGEQKGEEKQEGKAEPEIDSSGKINAQGNYAGAGAVQILAPTRFDAYNDIHPTGGDNSTVIGYLEMKINYSSRVADDAIRYAAFVETVDVRIEGMADQIRVTSSVIGDIKRLFGEFTKEGRELGGESLFKVEDLYDDIQACSLVFSSIIDRIYDVVRDLPSPSKGRMTRKKQKLEKVAQDYLEARMHSAEGVIHVYQWRLMIQVQTFSIRLSNQSTVEMKDMLANLIWGRSSNGQIYNAHGPVHFGFHPHYTGWEIQRPNPSGYAVKSAAQNLPWIVPDRPLAFSNEDLFLQAVGLRAQYVKEGRNLTEVYETLKNLPREAVDRLIEQQNGVLQQVNSPLEWKLAGLQTRKRREKGFRNKTVYLFVILKTEWKLQPGPRHKASPGATRGPAGIRGPASTHNLAEPPLSRVDYHTTDEDDLTGAHHFRAGPSGSQNPPAISVFSRAGSASDQATLHSRYSPPPSPDLYGEGEGVEYIYLERDQERIHVRSAPPPTPGPPRERSYRRFASAPAPGVYPEIRQMHPRPRAPEVYPDIRQMYPRPPPPGLHQGRPHIYAHAPLPQVRRREYAQLREQRDRDEIRRDPEYVHLWKDQDRRHWEEVYLGRVQRPDNLDLTVEEQDQVIAGLVSQWDGVVERLPGVVEPPPRVVEPLPRAYKKKRTSISTGRKYSRKRSRGLIFVRRKHSLTGAKVERVDP